MRVIIIGAGVVGLSTAYRLMKDGHDVTVLESGAYGEGPSHGNDAMVTNILSFPVSAPGTISQAARSFARPDAPISIACNPDLGYPEFLLRMAAATREHAFVRGTIAQDVLSRITFDGFDEFVADGLSFEMHRKGLLHVFESAAEYDAAMRLFEGFPRIRERVEPLVGHAALAEIDPGIDPAFTHGYFAPEDRQVEPVSLMDALVGALREHGVEVLEHTPVEGFVRNADGTVRAALTRSGAFDADVVVIAAGVGSRRLARELGFALPLFGGGGYSLDIACPDDVQPRTSVITGRTHIAISPLDRGLRVATGMVIGQRVPGVSQRRLERMVGHLHELYPTLRHVSADLDLGWSGLRPMSADGVPVIGALPGADNAILATGHAMLGLTYAPATATLVGRIVAGERLESDALLLSPERFVRRLSLGGRR